jgi:hypothetical protein
MLVRLVDGAAGKQRENIGRRDPLAGVRPGGMNPRIEGARRSAQRVDRQRRRNIRRPAETFRSQRRECGDGGRWLCAVDEREPFFRHQRHRGQRRRRERIASGHDTCVVADGGLAFADQDEREMRQRREIATRANRAAARDSRVHAPVQHFHQQIERAPPDARESFGEHVGAKRHRRADGSRRQKVADSSRMAAKEIQLKRAERVAWDSCFSQRAKTGVDSVDRLVARGLAIDDRTSRIDARHCRRRQRDGCVAIRDSRKIVEPKRLAIEKNHEY